MHLYYRNSALYTSNFTVIDYAVLVVDWPSPSIFPSFVIVSCEGLVVVADQIAFDPRGGIFDDNGYVEGPKLTQEWGEFLFLYIDSCQIKW